MNNFFYLTFFFFILLGLIITSQILNVFSIKNTFLTETKIELNNNNINHISSIRQLSSNQTYNNTYKNFFHKKKYISLWHTLFKENLFDGEVNYTNLTENSSQLGLMNLRVFIPNNGKFLEDENPTFKIRVFDNVTIDKWIFISQNKKIKKFFDIDDEIKNENQNITMYYYNESFMNLSYVSKFERGEYFSIPNKNKICNTYYNFNLIIDSVNKTEKNRIIKEKEIIGMKGSLYSEECKVKLEFDLERHSLMSNKIHFQIALYCFISSILSLFHTFSTKLFINKIEFSDVNYNSISILTICQNLIWNSYCCYSHFYLLLNFIEFKIYFGIICVLYFFNFGLLEFPLLYQLLTLKYSHMINDVLTYRKKLIQFCFVFYLVMLFCFIFAMKCFYSPYFIFFSYLITFLPQIIYNYNNKNRVSFPIIYIINLIFNRIYPSFYFCIFSKNFLRIPPNQITIILNLSFLIFLTAFLYSQTLLGPRWFIPFKEKGEYNFYLNEKDLRKLKKSETDALECLICLLPIIPKKNNDNTYNFNENINDNGLGYNETDNLVIEVNDNNINNLYNRDDKKMCKCRFKYDNKCCGEKSILFNFHEFSKNIHNLPYMITPCKHVFHSDCLEEWFKMKKECPSCRNIITKEMYN